MPEWSWISSALKLDAWRSAALAVAGALVLYLHQLGKLPFEVTGWLLTVVGLGTIAFGCVAAFSLVRSLFSCAALGVRYARARWSYRQARKETLSYLDTLSPREGAILGRLLALNERSFVGAIDGGLAAPLLAKRLIVMPSQMVTISDCTFVVPAFVWKELKRRAAEFPDSHTGSGNPWRQRAF